MAPDCCFLFLASHKPIDLLVLMLGTNDILHNPQYKACDAARGAEVLVKKTLYSECGPENNGSRNSFVGSSPYRGAFRKL